MEGASLNLVKHTQAITLIFDARLEGHHNSSHQDSGNNRLALRCPSPCRCFKRCFKRGSPKLVESRGTVEASGIQWYICSHRDSKKMEIRCKSDGNQMEAVYFALLWFLHGAVIAEPEGYMLLVQVRLGNVSLHIPNSTLCKCIEGTLVQWEFQDPKMEVLYHIRPYFGGYSLT